MQDPLDELRQHQAWLDQALVPADQAAILDAAVDDQDVAEALGRKLNVAPGDISVAHIQRAAQSGQLPQLQAIAHGRRTPLRIAPVPRKLAAAAQAAVAAPEHDASARRRRADRQATPTMPTGRVRVRFSRFPRSVRTSGNR